MSKKYFFSALSVPVYGLLYLFTILMILLGLPFMFSRKELIVRAMMRFWAKGIFILMGKKISVIREEIQDYRRHYILVSNHSSLFDIIAIISLFPDLVWFGHERLMKIPIFRRVLILTGYVPMRKATYRNTREMMELLKKRAESHNIAIFPEGTRTLNGKMNDFYRGFVILLRSTETDVLPVTLKGFYRLKPKNRTYIDFSSPLSITIHRLIPREELIKLSDSEIILVVRSVIEKSLTEDNGVYNGSRVFIKNKSAVYNG